MGRHRPRCARLGATAFGVTAIGVTAIGVAAIGMLAVGLTAFADPFPPNWGGGSGPAVHYPPVAWPADDGDGLLDFGDWQPYRFFGDDSQDQATQDPSNGGTSPQNYVNVSSGCTDLTIPSTFLYFDDANQVLMFRWRVEQIPFTYGTGAQVQPASNVDPWKSALWTVLFDTDADGYREFAVHLDGQSGLPSTPIDRLFFIYSNKNSNSIDYVNEADICLLGHNPTAFIDDASLNDTGNILNFQSAVNPTSVWSGGGTGRTVFDYGTTRGVILNQDADNDGSIECTEYFVDYQIPIAALDASASPCAGPALDLDTPVCLAFATANSLNNPVQKDIVFEGEVCGDGSTTIPTGDCFTLGGGTVSYVEQPIVNDVTATGCGPATLTASVSDAVGSDGCGQPLNSSIAAVDFFYYADDNANGAPDDGNAWTFAVAGTEDAVGSWSASWDSTLLSTGLYLIGVRATDDQGHVTWSYLTEAEVLAQQGAIDPDFANPSPTPGVLYEPLINSCGTSPTVTKSVADAEVPAGGTTLFTITVTASLADPLTVTRIDDVLPAGWSYVGTTGGSLAPDCGTDPDACPGGATFPATTGTVSWAISAAALPAGTSGTLVFEAQAPTAQGNYTNSASAVTDEGTFVADPVQVSVGAPRLTLAKDADVLSTTPGGTVTYTITYSNDSPVATTGTVITDPVPIGTTFVSATGGGSYDAGTGVVTWSVGTLFPGDGPFSVSFTVTVDDPLPAGATVPLRNTATIDSNETTPVSNDAIVFVNLPLRIQKRADTDLIAPGGSVTFSIDYANTGSAVAANATITDPVPTGYSFVSATGGGVHNGGTPGTVTWALGNLAPGAAGTVTVTLQASNPFTGTAVTTNTATLSATGLSSVDDGDEVGVTGQCVSTTFYMKNLTADVGVAGTRYLANTTVPTSPTQTQLPAGGLTLDNDGDDTDGIPGSGEMGRWYSDPPVGVGGIIVDDITATFFVDKTNGTKTNFTLQVFDYDPSTGTTVSLGSQTVAPSGGSGGTFQIAFTIAAGGASVAEDHRLLWVLRGANTSTGGLKIVTVAAYFDSVTNNSRSTACLSSFQSTLNKSVNALSVLPGGTLQYTIDFGNPGAGALTGATVVDVLPAGVSFVSATLNGAAATPAIAGQTLTFTVAGAGNPLGTISGGNSGTLVVNVAVANPLGADSTVLLNEATLTTTQAGDQVDQASTVVQRPNLVVAKTVDDTLLVPGDTATYTLTVTNAGTVDATSVDLDDDLPDQSYFVFGTCTVDATNAPSTTTTTCTESAGVLDATADVLAIGESLRFLVTMTVTTSPLPPPGLTSLDNVATVTSATDATVSSSETVTVTISTNPNLQITKSQTPAAGPLAAGDTLTYTLAVSNTGSADALDVLVYDPVPANTSYVAGSLTYEAAPQTDPVDGDTGAFDAVDNRPEWPIGTLAPGASRTMSFDVVLDAALPDGTTIIANTATVTSSNAGLKQASTTIDAQAAPDLSSLSKSAPSSMAFPLTTTVGAVTASTTVDVADTSSLNVLDYVHVGGTSAQITGISGTTLTLDTAVTAADGSNVTPVIPFVVQLTNDGTATATGVEVTDDLPAGTVFVAADSGGTHDGASPGTVTWSVGDLAPGASVTLRLWARPTTTGSFDNQAVASSNELADQPSNTTTTDIGVLEPSKSTSTPTVTNTNTGTTATYTIAVTNNSGATATNVEFVDTFEAGFSYASTTSINFAPNNGIATRTTTIDPTAGDNPATWCCWSLDPGGTISITFDVTIDPSVGDGTYQNELVTSSDNVSSLLFDPLATPDEDVTVDFTGPNHVVLTEVSARVDDRGRVLVTWETDVELGTLGFHVLRVDDRGLVPVTDDVLPSTQAPQGSRYQLLDPTASPDELLRYVLVEIQSDGRRPVYGPFSVDPRAPRPARSRVVAAPSPLVLAPGFAAAPRQQRPRPAAGRKALAPAGDPIDPSAVVALRVGVTTSGVHRLDADQLAAGFGLTRRAMTQAIRAGQLHLSVDGAPIAWLVDPFSDGDALVFYAEARETLYSAETIVRVELDRGRRMQTVAAPPRSRFEGAAFTADAGFHVDAMPFLFAGPRTGDEFWFWDLVASVPDLESRSFTLDAPGAVAGPATLHLEAQGLAGQGVENTLRVLVNGVAVGTARFGAIAQARPTFAFDGSILRDGANEIRVEAPTPAGGGLAVFAVDRFDLTWTRDYDARGGASFAFGGESHPAVRVHDLAPGDLLVLDVTDPLAAREVVGARQQVGADGVELRLSPPAPGRRYVATTAAGLLAPSSLEPDVASSLRAASNRADWLAIAPRALLDGARRLADHRAGQGLEVEVVALDDIYDEFNDSRPSPLAIRDFLAHARASWRQAPRFVVLLGEGTFDYKDAWGHGTNLVPPLIVAGPSGLFPSDTVLGDVGGIGAFADPSFADPGPPDGIPEIAVGRVPVLSAAELDAWVDKVIAYETADDAAWMNDLLFVADNADDTGDYPFEAAHLVGGLPAGFDPSVTSLGASTPATVRAALLAGFERGVGLVTVLGHASLTGVFHERVLTVDDLPLLTHGVRQPVVSALSCVLGNFAHPGFDTLAEGLVLQADGGAAAVLTASGLSYNVHRRVIGERFQQAVTTGGSTTLGDALLYALATRAVDRETLESQVLLGDPGMRLRLLDAPTGSP